MADLTCIILTKDEALHLERAITSLRGVARRVIVVDSGSTDATLDIARACGAEVAYNPWTNHAVQVQWAIDHLDIDTAWTFRLDADEYLTPALAEELETRLDTLQPDVAGVVFKRRVHFMGRWIKRGGYYPTYLLRAWRTGLGRCEQRWMDEHIVLARGRTVLFEHDLVDDNLNDLTWWTDKHARYATREAADILRRRADAGDDVALASASQARARRWLKERLYLRTPLFVRPGLYFAYRYVARLGFLDGREGLMWHTLQGFWYRFLVDAKLHEIAHRARETGKDPLDILADVYGIDVRD